MIIIDKNKFIWIVIIIELLLLNMIISKTPYRISFFGGGSDYPEWYTKNGGKILSSTIDKHIYLSFRMIIN